METAQAYGTNNGVWDMKFDACGRPSLRVQNAHVNGVAFNDGTKIFLARHAFSLTTISITCTTARKYERYVTSYSIA
jgi:hypothetical protein